MPTTTDQLLEWMAKPSETQTLEFKEAKNQFDSTKLYRYCVALANEGGGLLILGVTNDLPRQVVGTSAFGDCLEIVSKVFDAIRIRVDAEEVFHPDGRVLVFRVPPRPRGTAYHIQGAYLMRSGSDLVGMSEDQLRRIFDEGRPDWLEQASKIDLNWEQVIELLDTQTLFELLKLRHPASPAGAIDRLLALRLIDATGPTTFSIRRIGALLLARRLQDFDDISERAPRVIVYSGQSKLETRLDRVGEKGFAAGFIGLVRFICEHLPQRETIKNTVRVRVQLAPDDVIRELVANALVHQDFSVEGMRVTVEIYDDRVEISNPGLPIVPLTRFIDGSQSRNVRLAALMRRLGICEEKSSGIDRVVNAAEEEQLPAPDFREGHMRTEVRIYGPRKFDDMDRDARIRACYQHCALKYVQSQHMTNQSLRDRFQVPESKSAIVSQVISATIETGLIRPDERVGSSRKFARYVPFWG